MAGKTKDEEWALPYPALEDPGPEPPLRRSQDSGTHPVCANILLLKRLLLGRAWLAWYEARGFLAISFDVDREVLGKFPAPPFDIYLAHEDAPDVRIRVDLSTPFHEGLYARGCIYLRAHLSADLLKLFHAQGEHKEEGAGHYFLVLRSPPEAPPEGKDNEWFVDCLCGRSV